MFSLTAPERRQDILSTYLPLFTLFRAASQLQKVSRDYEAWLMFLGRHRVGNMNRNGEILTKTLCSRELAVMKTMFILPASFQRPHTCDSNTERYIL
ncbi:hypothetical protein EVAR_24712_1 [Eumeta japonica]|uniref:Uncharacterized protein n=1 Tax=Eumeta variegata TaxID=151549 RepID=A0A4C1VDV4_EUMVA|nr:hypothetical protein EVAR_24712_1 [Eumeta japonica]